jgi:hypothetical protein
MERLNGLSRNPQTRKTIAQTTNGEGNAQCVVLPVFQSHPVVPATERRHSHSSTIPPLTKGDEGGFSHRRFLTVSVTPVIRHRASLFSSPLFLQSFAGISPIVILRPGEGSVPMRSDTCGNS